MSDGKIDVPSQPVVIVRRRRGPVEEDHHGGVWKIAYADFMTALMAFFLVMWLVNAADKKTITQVAAYFNPIRLTDRSQSTKGLDDVIEGESDKPVKTKSQTKGKNKTKEKAKDKEVEKDDAEKTSTDEEPETAADLEVDKSPNAASRTVGEAEEESKLFSDPMGVLDKLAEKAKLSDDGKSAKTTAARSDAAVVRDPFDPAQRSRAEEAKPQTESKKTKKTFEAPQSAAPTSLPANVTKESKTTPAPGAADAVDKEIRAALTSMPNEGPSVEVKATPEGLLVSLVDDANFGMFKIGSAEPRPEVISIMDKIAGVLKSRNGRIVVRGHTDGRQFRNGSYDNWRLSADRAQMSYYMLVRGGIDQARFDAIEGRADRDLRVPGDAGAAQNRRIDILIKGLYP